MTSLAAWPLFVLLAAGPADLGPVPGSALRAFLVRHGQAYTNLVPPPDLPAQQLDRLTELGRAQARTAGEALRGAGVAVVVASPKGRTKETAEEIRSALGDVSVRVDERLRSLELGNDGAGRPLSWDDRAREWASGRDPSPPGGESLEQGALRMLLALSDLKREFAGRGVVVVSHSEMISNFVGMLEGRTLDGRFDVHIANGSICALEAPPASLPRLLFANFVPELRKAAEGPRARAARSAARRLAAP